MQACRILVISWWSNCLALTSIARLLAHAPGIPVSVIHVGKPERQKELFRRAQSPGVDELPYPEQRPGEHGAVLDYVLAAFRDRPEPLFCMDHDVFLEEQCDSWFERTAALHLELGHCLATPGSAEQASRTSPAFLLVPHLVPRETPSFLPIPPRHSAAARAPYAHRRQGRPVRPVKDTLVEACDYLDAHGLRATLGASSESPAQLSFPRHTHVGGLHALAAPPLEPGAPMHPAYLSHLREAFRNLDAFYAGCSDEFRNLEEPVLLERLDELRATCQRLG
jgi:hypothetical protein